MKSAVQIIVLLLLVQVFAACEKPDPNPELKDAQYQLYNEDFKAADAEVKSAEAAVTTARQEVKAATPQTGQIKFAEKRLWEAENKLSRMRQLKQLAQMRIQVRAAEVREKYLISYYNKTPLTELTKEELFKQRELASSSREWSIAKRRSALGLPTKSNKPGEMTSEASKKPEGGGH